MRVSIICAMDEKQGIGKDNGLLFQIPEDFQRMKQLTTGHSIIMGRKTFESKEINQRSLSGRTNIIVTRDKTYDPHKFCSSENCDVFVASSLMEAIKKAEKSLGSSEIFIFGGGQIYKKAMDKGCVDKLYLTIVKGNFGADTFFPDYSDFKKVVSEKTGESGGYKYKFLELER